MRSSVALTLAWLPLVLFYTDQGTSALPPDSFVKIKLPKANNSCFPAPIRDVRFYSVMTASGTEYVRHLISQAMLKCFQFVGGAVTEAARDFATCSKTADKKKKNVFNFNNTVCTTYAAMPPSALLHPCSGMGDVVVYISKTLRNNATLPVPKLINLQLKAAETGVIASWGVQDTCNLTQPHISMASVSVNKGTLTVSPAGNSVSTVIVTTPGVDAIATQTTYEISSVAPCVNVTVAPVDTYGRVTGTSVTVNTSTLGDAFFENLDINSGSDYINMDWNFLYCYVAAYNVTYTDYYNNPGFTLVNKSITSLKLIGISVCSTLKNITIAAIGYNNSVLASIDGPPDSTNGILPKVINLQLTPYLTSITATWSVQDTCNLTLSYNVKTKSSGFLIVTNSGSLTTYEIVGLSVCTSYSVTVMLQDLYGRAVGTSMTAEKKTLAPDPKVINLQLTPHTTSITASWNVEDPCQLQKRYSVKTTSVNSVFVVTYSGSFVQGTYKNDIMYGVGSQQTFEIIQLLGCTAYSVTVTAQNTLYSDFGTSMTADTTTFTEGTTPSIVSFKFIAVRASQIFLSWNFIGCQSIASYKLYHVDMSGVENNILLNNSVTALQIKICNFEVSSAYKMIKINAIDYNNNEIATSNWTTISGYMDIVYMENFSFEDYCAMMDNTSHSFIDALAYCQTRFSGDMFMYGNATYQAFTDRNILSNSWINLQFSPNTSEWQWGNGEVEANFSSNWATTPDPTIGYCAYLDANNNDTLTVVNCNASMPVYCFG